ncbi:putative autotransporter adhesin-like protein [Mucilaginibacter gracilis]|uniref:Putative autotransporter adhesin-like protein n=1 Tax=Mucilaginibacter gracilis TaxID=423350 RepID=A0A495J390_9SPHI|nr:head GIN domain-containing protein [Mucilaginibacter gracilis]RKR83082.1 putative autotransporter adhesin-like protein [Mucilaginibacter gracilis]
MKKINIVVLAIAASSFIVALSSCNGLLCKSGSGKMITEKRDVKGFSKLDISGSYTVVIKQDSVESISVTADDNLMKYVKVNLDGDKLRVHSKGNICGSGKFLLTISLRNLSALKTSGAVEVSSNGKIIAKDLDMNMSGASKVTLDVDANSVTTTGSGITEINLTGQASSHNVELSGSGQLNALDFVVATYDIESSGVSHCKINVLNQLNINSSGVADVQYKGNPAKINNNKSGASTLKKIE